MTQFHFLHPIWLVALLPLTLLLWLSFRAHAKGNAWEKVIDPNLLAVLLQGEDKHTGRLVKWLVALGWLITTIALADPVWEKIPKPVFQTNTARVLVLDLSSSMMIDDLKPTRLARARFKIEDILSSQFLKNEEGQTGLVVFAGDAFTVSPLTRDVGTIRSLLKVLSPQLLPAQGSRVDLGLKKAYELLKQSGAQNGSVLLIADGIADEGLALTEASTLKNAGHQLSVLGVGTEAGGLLPSVRRQQGLNITVKLETDSLQALAKKGGGSYHAISNNNADLNQLLKRSDGTGGGIQNEADLVDEILSNDLKNEEWKSMGPFLIIFLLPLAALAFRKGWLFNIIFAVFIVGLVAQPQNAMAFSFEEQWDKLWQNKAQRAESALQQKQYDKASQLAKSPLRRGSAEYRKGEYNKALESFKNAKGADARFDEGNALAKLEKYEEAIKAYDEALKEQPEMQDAKDNKKAIKAFLKKKKEQQKKNKSGKDSKQSKDKKDDSKSEKDSQKKKGDKEQEDKKKGDKKGDEKGNKGDKKDNQFSDANKDLDKDKKDKEEGKKNEPEDEATKSKEEKQKEQQKQQNSTQKDAEEKKRKAEAARSKAKANELNKEEKMAAEQWLRRIPDDPSGLLRRKFQRQYQRRRNNPQGTKRREAQPW
ncbi:MAG: VWA domain-containing protein [Cocleimonas sp.]